MLKIFKSTCVSVGLNLVHTLRQDDKTLDLNKLWWFIHDVEDELCYIYCPFLEVAHDLPNLLLFHD